MNYGSVTSGIEAATVAWHPLGWVPQWFSEIEPFPCKVLKHHYPNVPNLGDMLKIRTNETFRNSVIDILVGGTPCQSFSLAGLRGGLVDERGNLALEFCRILADKRPCWFVWENVPGVFSSFSDETESKRYTGSRGNLQYGNESEGEFDITQTADFATLLNAFSECGYSCAWRVLDSQYFGVPQRRRRVFVVGHIGTDWRPPFAVLFERESLRRNPAPGRESREGITRAITQSPFDDRGDAGNLIKWPADLASCLNTKYGDKMGLEDQHINQGAPLFVPQIVGALTAKGPEAMGAPEVDAEHYIVMASGQSNAPISNDNLSPALTCLHEAPIIVKSYEAPAIGEMKESDTAGTTTRHTGAGAGETQNPAFLLTMREGATDPNAGGKGPLIQVEKSATLKAVNNQTLFHTMVRRLTPLECERLQGFPDNYTNIPGAKDGPRYKALGNSMTTNVMNWIGSRIDKVDKIFNK